MESILVLTHADESGSALTKARSKPSPRARSWLRASARR